MIIWIIFLEIKHACIVNCNEPNLKTYPYVTDAAIVTFPRIDKYHKFETFTYLSTWKGITGYSSRE